MLHGSFIQKHQVKVGGLLHLLHHLTCILQAILTITVQTPRTPDALRKNPLGIFVNAINWSKELGS